MTIGLFSPLPPARTGVADYAAALSTALSAHGAVHPNAPGDVNLYQIGNNRLHAADLARAVAHPGVVTLHDASLQHLYLATLSEDAYADEFTFNYGAWFGSLGRELYRGRAGSGLREEYGRFPMLRRVVSAARSVVVHNAAAARAVESHGGNAEVIPHLDLPRTEAGAAAPPPGVTFSIFGYLRESKRVLSVLRAFVRVHAVEPRTRLVLAGSWASDDLPRTAAPLLDHPAVAVTGYLSPAAFDAQARACDVCVNLRHPSLGETSGVTIRLMSMAKPVLVTASEENAAFPRGSVAPVDAGPGEEDVLFETMLWLARTPAVRRDIGCLAQAHIHREHAPARVAQRYWEVLCSSS